MSRGVTIWLTGLSGSGKSTIAEGLAEILRTRGRNVEILDGDVIRENLSKGLGFSREDRDTNIARIAFVASIIVRLGGVAIVAAISPYAAARAQARSTIGSFVEVHVACPLDELVRRDVKGLYAKALRGDLPHFTGVSDPYEAPSNPEIRINTSMESPGASVARILAYLDSHSTAHGGRLVDRMASFDEARALREEVVRLPQIRVGSRVASDLRLIGIGALSPLEGFMTRRDYDGVVSEMRLANGLPWTLPVTVSVSDDQVPAEGSRVALVGQGDELLAVLDVTDRYRYDKQAEALAVYRTEDLAHPGVAALHSQGTTLLGGRVTVLPFANGSYALTPRETRAEFAQRGWGTVVGFQTRNPIHRAHEYIQKCALETADGLFVHPLVGDTKADDVPADVRVRCYQALLEGYYPPGRTFFSVLPAAMRYAGPREAVFHALIRKNYGCTHFIVGRDHAGVGNYYGTYDAQRIFESFTSTELGITPLKFENSFYCSRCDGMASEKTCAHLPEDRLSLSGTAVRAMLAAGTLPPPEFTRPEVAQILVEANRDPMLVSGQH